MIYLRVFAHVATWCQSKWLWNSQFLVWDRPGTAYLFSCGLYGQVYESTLFLLPRDPVCFHVPPLQLPPVCSIINTHFHNGYTKMLQTGKWAICAHFSFRCGLIWPWKGLLQLPQGLLQARQTEANAQSKTTPAAWLPTSSCWHGCHGNLHIDL